MTYADLIRILLVVAIVAAPFAVAGAAEEVWAWWRRRGPDITARLAAARMRAGRQVNAQLSALAGDPSALATADRPGLTVSWSSSAQDGDDPRPGRPTAPATRDPGGDADSLDRVRQSLDRVGQAARRLETASDAASIARERHGRRWWRLARTGVLVALALVLAVEAMFVGVAVVVVGGLVLVAIEDLEDAVRREAR